MYRETLRAVYTQFKSTEQIFIGFYTQQLSKLTTTQLSINMVTAPMPYPVLAGRFSARRGRVLLHCSLEEASNSLLWFFFSLAFSLAFHSSILLPESLSCIFDSKRRDEISKEWWGEEQIGRLKGRTDDGDFSGGKNGCGLDSRHGSWKTRIVNTEPNIWRLDES